MVILMFKFLLDFLLCFIHFLVCFTEIIKGKVLSGHDIYAKTGVSFEKCKLICLLEETCKLVKAI